MVYHAWCLQHVPIALRYPRETYDGDTEVAWAYRGALTANNFRCDRTRFPNQI